MFKYLFTLAFIITSLGCHALELSNEETVILEKFFRVLIEKSEGGYVLNNNKPLCIVVYHNEDYFQNAHEHHAHAVCLREGAKIWKKLSLNPTNSNILVHIYDHEDDLDKNSRHLLFINKKLFHETVKSNLPLFQYVLGPEITSETLLTKLTDPRETLYSTLKNDKILIGILMGFGAQNSLYMGRIAHLNESLLSTSECPPFKSKLSQMDDIPIAVRQQILVLEGKNNKHSFETLFSDENLSLQDEEFNKLSKKMEISSPKLIQESPPFLFGHLREDKESDKLINNLEMSQLQIRMLLNSHQFLKDVLSLIYPREEITTYPSPEPLLAFSPEECSQFTRLVAANIWNVLEGHSHYYQEAFIDGMLAADVGESLRVGLSDPLKYEKLKMLIKIKNNLKQSDSLFSELNDDSRFICVMPFKLYYRVKQEGVGPSLVDQLKVQVKYIIKTPQDKIILSEGWSNNQATWIHLQDVIQGFAWGMKGMKVGETREIYIHPSLGYGIYTTFDKGIYLKAIVKLCEINQALTARSQVTQLSPFEFESEMENIDFTYAEEEKKTGYYRGYQVWQHYKKGQFCSLPEVLTKIASWQKSPEDFFLQSQENQDLINRMHWNIYNRTEVSAKSS